MASRRGNLRRHDRLAGNAGAPNPVGYACRQLRTGPVSMCTYLDRG